MSFILFFRIVFVLDSIIRLDYIKYLTITIIILVLAEILSLL